MLSYFKFKLLNEYAQLSLWYFVSFIFGIIIYFSTENTLLNNSTKLICIILIICVFLYARLKNKILLTFISSCFLSFLIGIFVSYVRLHFVDTILNSKIITSYIEGNIESIKPTNRGDQLIINDVIIAKNNSKLNKVRLQLKTKNNSLLKINDRIIVKAKLYPLQHAILPYSYNFGFHSYMSSISATASSLGKVKILQNNDIDKKTRIKDKINQVRMLIHKRLIESMGKECGNFTSAILLGETKDLDEKITNDMRNSGISHILCVSGLHLSLIAGFFFLSTRFILNISNFLAYNLNIKFIAAIFSILGSAGYLLLSGSNIAAIRAFIMTTIFMISILIDRAYYPIRSLFIAAFVLLSFRPEYIFNPSFQLSFTAVLCLISGYELNLKQYFPLSNSSIFSYFIMNVYSTILASVFTAPFVIYHFYKLANYSIIANLFAVPIMSFCIMPIALTSIILMPINLDQYLLKILSIFINILFKITSYINNLSGSVTHIGYIDNITLLIFTIGFFFLCLWQSNLRFIGLIFCAIALFLKFYKTEPDMILDFHRKIFSVKTIENKFAFYSDKKVNKFIIDYWFSWHGASNENIIKEEDLLKKDYIFETRSGYKIALNYKKCQKADLQIITSPDLRCSKDGNILEYTELSKSNLMLIYCDKKNCKIKHYESAQDKLYTAE